MYTGENNMLQKVFYLIPLSLSLVVSTLSIPITTQPTEAQSLSYVIVDTGQHHCYADSGGLDCPTEGAEFYGQDAQYQGNEPSYQDNGDGTITDLNTGLMWQKTPDLVNKVTLDEAYVGAETLDLGDYTDWRVPTIKELYSLIDFGGSLNISDPYIDTAYFDFVYGNTDAGEREIDAQYWSSTEYVGMTEMNGTQNPTAFGVNFADGRIKGYPILAGQREGRMFVRYVRGNVDYGVNDFADNGDGTITDQATSLVWMQTDSGMELDWSDALAYCEDLSYAGVNDWRLPNAKELQSIVDYTRAPEATDPAQQGVALDPIFEVTEIESWYWSSTTLNEGMGDGIYVTFGQAFGEQNGELNDVHGAGSQRSDPKAENTARRETGTAPQGDEIRIYNYVRCVRAGDVGITTDTQSGSTVPTSQLPGPPDGNTDQGNSNGNGQPPNSNGQGPSGGNPPQEAISACNGLSAGSSCEVSTPNGTISGTCQQMQSQLACVPAGGPPQ